MEFTVFELEVLKSVLDQGGGSSPIEELRLIESAATTITNLIPERKPEPVPQLGQPPELVKDENREWREEMHRISSWVVEVTLSEGELGVIRALFKGAGFSRDPNIRPKLVALATKLGV